MKITRKQVNAIYAGMKAWKLEYNAEAASYLYDQVADHEVDEDTARTIRCILDYLFEAEPVWTYDMANKALAKIAA